MFKSVIKSRKKNSENENKIDLNDISHSKEFLYNNVLSKEMIFSQRWISSPLSAFYSIAFGREVHKLFIICKCLLLIAFVSL